MNNHNFIQHKLIITPKICKKSIRNYRRDTEEKRNLEKKEKES